MTPRARGLRLVGLAAAALASVGLAGCAGSGASSAPGASGTQAEASSTSEAASPYAPVLGTWAYPVETPQGPFDGTMEIEMQGDGTLGGTIASNQLGETLALEDVTFEGRRLDFGFESAQAGYVTVSVAVAGDTFAGEVQVGGGGPLSGDGVNMFPIEGTRTAR
jgi:hypothetical protein